MPPRYPPLKERRRHRLAVARLFYFRGLLGINRRIQHLHPIINHRLDHSLQVMRSPGVTVRLLGHRRIFCEQLGDVEKIGGGVQGVLQGDTAVNA